MTARTVLRVVGAGVALAVVGATAFGLWHVVVGSGIRGNVRAGEFGVALTVLGAVLLVVLAMVARRARARPPA